MLADCGLRQMRESFDVMSELLNFFNLLKKNQHHTFSQKSGELNVETTGHKAHRMKMEVPVKVLNCRIQS